MPVGLYFSCQIITSFRWFIFDWQERDCWRENGVLFILDFVQKQAFLAVSWVYINSVSISLSWTIISIKWWTMRRVVYKIWAIFPLSGISLSSKLKPFSTVCDAKIERWIDSCGEFNGHTLLHGISVMFCYEERMKRVEMRYLLQ